MHATITGPRSLGTRPRRLIGKPHDPGRLPALVLFVSDNESWVDARPGGRGTGVMEEWAELRRRNPRARLVCLDIQPRALSQAPEREDILNIGGFSDQVFRKISEFAAGHLSDGHWVDEIEKVDIA